MSGLKPCTAPCCYHWKCPHSGTWCMTLSCSWGHQLSELPLCLGSQWLWFAPEALDLCRVCSGLAIANSGSWQVMQAWTCGLQWKWVLSCKSSVINAFCTIMLSDMWGMQKVMALTFRKIPKQASQGRNWNSLRLVSSSLFYIPFSTIKLLDKFTQFSFSSVHLFFLSLLALSLPPTASFIVLIYWRQTF